SGPSSGCSMRLSPPCAPFSGALEGSVVAVSSSLRSRRTAGPSAAGVKLPRRAGRGALQRHLTGGEARDIALETQQAHRLGEVPVVRGVVLLDEGAWHGHVVAEGAGQMVGLVLEDARGPAHVLLVDLAQPPVAQQLGGPQAHAAGA